MGWLVTVKKDPPAVVALNSMLKGKDLNQETRIAIDSGGRPPDRPIEPGRPLPACFFAGTFAAVTRSAGSCQAL